jgi:hypothetical protein
MKLEDLLKEGFTEDQAKKILEIHKKAIDGNFVPKETFNAEREKLKTANETIADRDKQITELGKFKGTAEELQKKVDTLTADNTKKDQEYQAKLKDMEETTAIRASISDKVYSVDDILPRLDRTKMTFKDGQVVAGLVEQMDAIKQASPHYFKEVKGNGGNQGGFPGGWHPFGKSPEESKGQGGADSAAEFGKSLAKAQSQGMNSTQKAADMYFK